MEKTFEECKILRNSLGESRKKIYYAHCMNLYYTDREKEDIKLLKKFGWNIVNPSDEKYKEDWKTKSMGFAEELVGQCDALVFRRATTGRIPSGVGVEIILAIRAGIPVLEIPSSITEKDFMTREETRKYILSHGPEVDWYRERISKNV